MPFRIINKDITTIKVDALVNSTNDSMIGFSGVDELIHKLGGEEFENECAKHRDELRYGEAIYTNGNVRQPKKNTIVAMAFAMRLTYEEAEMLLSAAGFTFADNDMFDVITSWYLKNRKYNQYDIDTQLVKYGAPALFSEA